MEHIKLKRNEFEYITYNNDCIIVDTDIKGRCIIANRDYEIGEIVCINPILLVERNVMNSILRRYCFCPPTTLGLDSNKVIIMLGIGFLFCHSKEPNLYYVFDYRKRIVTFTTTMKVKRGYELTNDYHTVPWFDVLNDIEISEHLGEIDGTNKKQT